MNCSFSLRGFVAVAVRRGLGGLVFFVALSAVASPIARGEDVILEKVPAAIREAADKAVKGAKWASATKETDEDKLSWYDLEGKDAKGRYVCVSVYTDGTVDEVCTEVTADDVPKVVSAALTAKMPKFKVATYYEVRLDGKVERYDFEGKRPRDKEEITVSVSPDGKTVEIDE